MHPPECRPLHGGYPHKDALGRIRGRPHEGQAETDLPRTWYSNRSSKDATLSFVSLRWMRRAAGRGKPMAWIMERGEAHYEAREVPFGRVYEWHRAYVALECECGEKLILSATSTITACRCGADLGALALDIREREGRVANRLTHPWFHDARMGAEQRLRDEAAYPKGSPWRYDDITADDG
jgi:hypothetical protein